MSKSVRKRYRLASTSVAMAEPTSAPQHETHGEVSLVSLVHNFVSDLKPTFPEVADELVGVERLTQEQFVEAAAPVYAESFFYILQKNDELFEAKGRRKGLELLPGVDFCKLWNADGITDGTREAMWRHLQLIMFELIPLVGDKAQFGDSASLFEAITPDQLQEQIESAFTNLNLEGDGEKGENGEEADPGKAERVASEFTEHISGLMGGNLGRLANEIAEEVGHELGLTRNATQKEVMELLRDPTRMMSLVKKIGKKLEEKIASGEVKESELLKEAAEVVDKLKDIPGAENLRKMFGSGFNSKASQSATEAALKQRMGKAKTKERLQAKLAAKREAAAAAAAAQNATPSSVPSVELGGQSMPAVNGAGPGSTSEWLPEPQPRSAPRRKKNNKKKR
jgi:hypothetical protein